jgi:hypothetical protein
LVCGKIPQYGLNAKLGGYLILALSSAAMSRIQSVTCLRVALLLIIYSSANVIDTLRGHLRAKFWPPAVKGASWSDIRSSLILTVVYSQSSHGFCC